MVMHNLMATVHKIIVVSKDKRTVKREFLNDLIKSISLFSVGTHFDITLILWTLTVKLCMAIALRPNVCGVLKCLSYVCMYV
jgi:hypothetical protein